VTEEVRAVQTAMADAAVANVLGSENPETVVPAFAWTRQ